MFPQCAKFPFVKFSLTVKQMHDLSLLEELVTSKQYVECGNVLQNLLTKGSSGKFCLGITIYKGKNDVEKPCDGKVNCRNPVRTVRDLAGHTMRRMINNKETTFI